MPFTPSMGLLVATLSSSVGLSPSASDAPLRLQSNDLGGFFQFQDAHESGPVRTWIPVTVISSVVLAGGVGCWVSAFSIHSRLSAGDSSVHSQSQLSKSVANGKLLQNLGWGLSGAGAVGLGVGVFLALSGPPPVKEDTGYGLVPEVAPLSGGGLAAVIHGTLP